MRKNTAIPVTIVDGNGRKNDLLKKASDSAGLDAATRKLKEHYTDVDNRRIKKIFAKFDELGISPITLPKS